MEFINNALAIYNKNGNQLVAPIEGRVTLIDDILATAVLLGLVLNADRGGGGLTLPLVTCWSPTQRARSGDFLCRLIHCGLYSTGMAVMIRIDMGTLARVGTALADPTRRQVLVHLIDGPGYPAEMAEEFGTSRANLSNHLTCLRECGLVTATAEGRRIRYELADQRLADGLRILAALDLPGSCG